MQRIIVDLPEPEGPQITIRSPRMTLRSMFFSTWKSPYHLSTPINSTATECSTLASPVSDDLATGLPTNSWDVWSSLILVSANMGSHNFVINNDERHQSAVRSAVNSVTCRSKIRNTPCPQR